MAHGMKKIQVALCLAFALFGTSAAHSMMIRPKPRNAVDSSLPEWSNGTAPYRWTGGVDAPTWPCACRNGSQACESAQTCLWMSVGCSIGCAECDGGSKGGANPNGQDRCNGGMKATINDPKHRTLNRNVTAFSADDWTRWNPWRAPGSAPVYDPCGRAGGAGHSTPGHGEFTNTTFAKMGDLGTRLPYQHSGTVWEAGSAVETWQAIRANHGGGYQYRLCPLEKMPCTEADFQETPMPFADSSSLMLSNGTVIKLTSTFVSEGTLPKGGTWQMLPIPDTHHVQPGGRTPVGPVEAWTFPPPCFEPRYVENAPLGSLAEGRCSGQWISNITLMDQLTVPAHLAPGEYVLGLRWDCETSAQVWQSCADVTITAPKLA